MCENEKCKQTWNVWETDEVSLRFGIELKLGRSGPRWAGCHFPSMFVCPNLQFFQIYMQISVPLVQYKFVGFNKDSVLGHAAEITDTDPSFLPKK